MAILYVLSMCGFSARSAENGHVQKESTALPKAEHADCISPKKLFEKSGLEGLCPSKYPLFLAGGGHECGRHPPEGKCEGHSPSRTLFSNRL